MLAPLVIPKSKVQFEMTELCIQDEVCHFEIPVLDTYNNYICMGDEVDPDNMHCRMLRTDADSMTNIDVSFRCKRSLFEDASTVKREPCSDIHSCYYVGDNAIQIKESEHDSVTDTLACIRQKHACKLPYKFAIGQCHDDNCLVETRDAMKKECNYQCNR